jgi:hypothetical protein
MMAGQLFGDEARAAWEAAGSTNYNQMVREGVSGFQSTDESAPTYALNDGRTTTDKAYAQLFNNPVAPTAPIAAPVVPGAAPAAPIAAAPGAKTWDTEKLKPTSIAGANGPMTVEQLFNATAPSGMTGQQLWEWQNAGSPGAAPVAPVAGPGAPVVPGAGGQPDTSKQVATPVNYWESDQYKKDKADARADALALAEANKQAMQFAQGIEQGKLDIAKASQAASEAYNKAMLEFNDRQLAQQAANAAMDVELRRQTIQIQSMSARRQSRQGGAFTRGRRPAVSFA